MCIATWNKVWVSRTLAAEFLSVRYPEDIANQNIEIFCDIANFARGLSQIRNHMKFLQKKNN